MLLSDHFTYHIFFSLLAGDRGGFEAVSAGDEVDGDELHADHHRDNSLGVRGELETSIRSSRGLLHDNENFADLRFQP